MARGFPSMTALLGLLAIAGYQNRDKIAEMIGGATGQGGAGSPQGGGQRKVPAGLDNLLGGLGGGGLGGLLGGGLSDLVENFRRAGQGDVADSWVGRGPNKQVTPQNLEQAIGPEVLATLSRETGLSHEELLSRLSRNLPEAVDKYTPDGRIPSEQEWARS
ncbi:MAG TPA: YidB family protein [Beijerinckiaceae bacterium]|nr:YidB family protein [Beijerinckiaceae bacterium]